MITSVLVQKQGDGFIFKKFSINGMRTRQRWIVPFLSSLLNKIWYDFFNGFPSRDHKSGY